MTDDAGTLPGPSEKAALRFGERTLTFRQLDERAARCATAIAARGAGPGDRVAVMLPNGVEFFEFCLGAPRAGCRVVPINWHLRSEEVSWLLRDSEARVLAVDAPFLDTARGAVGADSVTSLLVVGGGGQDDFDTAVASADPAPGAWSWPEYVYYTSGTTGRPRGVERPAAAAGGRQVHSGLAAMWGITENDVWLACSPLYHAANGYAFTTLSVGGTVVVLERWDARKWLEAVQRHRVTACFMVPAHFIRLLEIPEEERAGYDLSSLRLVLHAAAPCPVPVKWQILEALPSAQIWEFYGATEGGATRISPDEWRTHPGSVGRPWPGVDVQVRDDEGRRCAPGQTGTIYVRPAEGARFHYRNDAEKTDRAWREDAFTVGDMGHIDDDGYLYITDRASDMVLRGGVNIYPAEIEAVLHRHPLVVDCAVFGVPDERSGEELQALVETRGPVDAESLTESLTAFLRRHLADFKVPRSIDIVDTLPRDPTGKVVKRRLREQYWTGARNAVVSD